MRDICRMILITKCKCKCKFYYNFIFAFTVLIYKFSTSRNCFGLKTCTCLVAVIKFETHGLCPIPSSSKLFQSGFIDATRVEDYFDATPSSYDKPSWIITVTVWYPKFGRWLVWRKANSWFEGRWVEYGIPFIQFIYKIKS